MNEIENSISLIEKTEAVHNNDPVRILLMFALVLAIAAIVSLYRSYKLLLERIFKYSRDRERSVDAAMLEAMKYSKRFDRGANENSAKNKDVRRHDN